MVQDEYDVAGNGTGFSLGRGVNSGIEPPATRLTGTASANLRYIPTGRKTTDAFAIVGNRLEVAPAADPGRFALSADGTNSFDFAPAIGAGEATPQDPVTYDLSIRMANNSEGRQRFSFALGTGEGPANTWSFGIQLYRTNGNDDFYTIGKRIDPDSSGLAEQVNTFITHTEPGIYGSEIDFLMRVTEWQEDGFFSITWSSVGGTRYRIQFTDTLESVFKDILRTPESEIDPSPYGAPSSQSFAAPSGHDEDASQNTGFYRIKVAP